MASFWQWLFGEGSPEATSSSGPSRPGTRVEDVQVIDVTDGDTLRVELQGQAESLRLICLDTEESHSGGSKPVTEAGKLAAAMAKEFFQDGDGWGKVSIEFESNAPLEECLQNERGNYGRLLCYVYKGNQNYNLHAIQGGWSPYFVKYGYARFFHREFLAAEAEAQSKKRVIWDPETNEGGPRRDYSTLLPWWLSRGALMEGFRREGRAKGALEVRADYPALLDAMKEKKSISLFCDLQEGIANWSGSSAVIYVGTKDRPFSLWIPDARSPEKEPLLRLIEHRYAQHGRGFVYVTGEVTSFRDKPQIVLTDSAQFSDELA